MKTSPCTLAEQSRMQSESYNELVVVRLALEQPGENNKNLQFSIHWFINK